MRPLGLAHTPTSISAFLGGDERFGRRERETGPLGKFLCCGIGGKAMLFKTIMHHSDEIRTSGRFALTSLSQQASGLLIRMRRPPKGPSESLFVNPIPRHVVDTGTGQRLSCVLLEDPSSASSNQISIQGLFRQRKRTRLEC